MIVSPESQDLQRSYGRAIYIVSAPHEPYVRAEICFIV